MAARKGPSAPDPYPLFAALLRQLGAPAPVREHPVCPDRAFRFDYAWPDHGRIAVEVDGGIWRRSGKGAHSGGTAIKRGMEKHNLAVLHGWRVLRFMPEQLLGGAPLVVQLLTGEGNKDEAPALGGVRSRKG